MLDPQNFSVYAGNPTNVVIDVDPDTIGLDSSEIIWRAYEQEFGQPVDGEDAVIEKNGPSTDGGILITDPDEKKITITLLEDDTVDRLRNYYHEATIDGVTIAHGIMTVLGTENR